MKQLVYGKVSYCALQKMLERAYDENDMERVMVLSCTMDEASRKIIAQEAVQGCPMNGTYGDGM